MSEFNRNWLKLALEYKDNSDVTFNLSQNDIRILLTYIEILQSKIDKANEVLNKLCVMKPWNDSEEEMRKIYRPIKNTSKQEVYKAICDLRDILKEDK